MSWNIFTAMKRTGEVLDSGEPHEYQHNIHQRNEELVLLRQKLEKERVYHENTARELAQIKRMLESVQRNLHIGVWEVDLKTNQMVWTEEMFDICEMPHGNTPTVETILSFFHPDFQEVIHRSVTLGVEHGVAWDLEVKLITNNNREMWVGFTGVPVVEEGKTVHLKGLVQDIDQRKRIEEKLRTSQEIMYLSIEAGEIGIWNWDIKNDRLEWSQYMHEHFGRPIIKFTGKFTDFTQSIHIEDLSEVTDILEKSIYSGGRFNIEFRVVTEENTVNYLFSQGLVLKDEHDKPDKMIGICLNITDKKKAEEALRESEEKFRSAIEYSAIGIAIVAIDGMCLKVNKALEDTLGYSEEELLLSNLQSITHPEDIEKDRDELRRLLSGAADTYMVEKRFLHKSKNIIWTQINATVVKNPQGKPLYFIFQLQDITTRKRSEQEMVDINADLERLVKVRTEKLEAANRELEAFTYSMSHDLRAPLRSINGYAKILREDYYARLDNDGNEIIQIVINNAKRMGLLIDDLLEFSRMGRLAIKKTLASMNPMVENVLAELTAFEEKRDIRFNIHPLAASEVDMQMIKQVWINLLSNAIKYTRKTAIAQIEVGSYTEENAVTYYVKDNGVGFDMQYAHKLFGVFQRLHKAGEFEGTGVGLALVKRIVTMHDGRIWAEGKPNQGAAFYFSIPK